MHILTKAMYALLVFFLNKYVLVIITALLSWYFCTSNFKYWKRQKIKYQEKPVPFFGNIAKFALNLQTYHDALHELYFYFRDEPFGGYFEMRDPVLLIRDPDLVHNILVKDFKNFYDRGLEMSNPDKKLNPLSVHLFHANGDRWRALRRRTSPIFTSGKLKSMYPQITDCVNKLNTMLEKEMVAGNVNVNLKGMFERLTTDVIGSCAFGIECNSIETNNQFSVMGEKIFKPTWVSSARIIISVFSKKLLGILKLSETPKEVADFFLKLVFDTIHYRRSNNISRPDLLQLLMEIQNAFDDPKYVNPDQQDSGLGNERFDEVHVAANSFLFFIAGFETTATALSYCLYELALNKSIQDKLREEIESLGRLKTDNMKENTYLDAVLLETLRKYPPIPWIARKAADDYLIPDTNTVIQQGTRLIIPTWSIHHDYKNYENPELFNPDRFFGVNMSKIRNGIFLPFGDGPRNCIGSRFAKMELRVALADLIMRYKFSPCSQTQIPIKYTSGSFLITSKNGIWINMRKLE